MNFVVHHQCYRNKKATEFALKSFREYHPNDPYVMWSDGGDDFSDIAEKYDADFNYSNVNIASAYRDKSQVFELFDRVRKTCEKYPDKPYVMYMEDDVLVKGKISIPSEVDFCGWSDVGNKFVRHLGHYNLTSLHKKYSVNPNFDYWTAAGGVIMSSDVFTNKFKILEKFIDEDYESISPDFTKVVFYDVLFMLAHLICDKKYSVWDQITEVHRNPDWNSDKYAVVHGYKEQYN
jgi:hypothetical protein